MGWKVSFVTPVLFSILGIKIFTFGFFMALALFVGIQFGQRELDRRKMKGDASTACMSCILSGIVGSKLHYVIMSQKMDELFSFSTGLSYQGGFICGASALFVWCWYHRLPVLPITDIGGYVIVTTHAVGKLGCFFSGDGCYGAKTSMPWGMSFPNGLVPTRAYHHPAPLYEFAMDALLAVALYRRSNMAGLVPGTIAGWSLVGQGVMRFIIEFVRDHEKTYKLPLIRYSITEYQWIAIWISFSGVIYLLVANAINKRRPTISTAEPVKAKLKSQ